MCARLPPAVAALLVCRREIRESHRKSHKFASERAKFDVAGSPPMSSRHIRTHNWPMSSLGKQRRRRHATISHQGNLQLSSAHWPATINQITLSISSSLSANYRVVSHRIERHLYSPRSRCRIAKIDSTNSTTRRRQLYSHTQAAHTSPLFTPTTIVVLSCRHRRRHKSRHSAQVAVCNH